MRYCFLCVMVRSVLLGSTVSARTPISPCTTPECVVSALITITDTHRYITPHTLIETLQTEKSKLSSAQKQQFLERAITDIIKHYYQTAEDTYHSNNQLSSYNALVSYQIEQGQLQPDTTNTHHSLRHQQLRTLITQLFPATYISKLAGIHLFSDTATTETAAVYPTASNDGKRELVINTATFYPDGQLHAASLFHLLHELGHIVTLDALQFSEERPETCPTYRLDEGCLTADSYLFQFVASFRSGAVTPTDTFDETRFVSTYAQTDPVEDIAETFAAFLLEGTPNDDSTLSKKIRFFSTFEEFLSLKSHLQSVLNE